MMGTMRSLTTRWVPTACALSIWVGSAGPLHGEECKNGIFNSTFELIQKAIFENRGCTSSLCHDATAAGGLDLSPDVAYENLIDKPSQTVPHGTISGLHRVVPGQKDQSLLFINLAAATSPQLWKAPIRPMPQGGLPPLSLDELDAVREWIENGAPRDGVVPGTDELLDACLPAPKPIEIEPLAPPPPGTGVQVRMPRWHLDAESEREVCFVSYYDVTDQVPAEFRGPNGDTFRIKRRQIRQDPLSHHLIINHYGGAVPPSDPIWGEFRCRGGERDGEPCEPTEQGACGDALCGSEPRTSLACVGFGPGDRDTNSRGFGGTQERSFEQTYPEGVYAELPLRGTLIWNSHAFNLTDERGKLEAWVNMDFAAPDEQQIRVRGIFNTSLIFEADVPPFRAQELCQHNVFPPNTQLFELNSHTHKRGKRFRIFEGAFRCSGGSNDGAPCSPFGPDTGFETPDICDGAPCESKMPPSVGDCNSDLDVSIAELVLGVNIALEKADVSSCPRFDGDGNGAVAVSELVSAVRAVIEAAVRDPEESLLYTSFTYSDPVVLHFDPPMTLGREGSHEAERTLTYCSLYDNGFTDPDEVKRKSTSPETPLGIPGVVGGPCVTPTGCTEGLIGAACSGRSQAERDASCDSRPGAGDGFCDACRLRGGVTTEDEMFILMGAFFVR